jgi:hypothetical protein
MAWIIQVGRAGAMIKRTASPDNVAYGSVRFTINPADAKRYTRFNDAAYLTEIFQQRLNAAKKRKRTIPIAGQKAELDPNVRVVIAEVD